MSAFDKLLKFANSKNIATLLDEEKQQEIADQVVLGYKIDSKSKEGWVETNKKAIALIKYCEENPEPNDSDGLYEGAVKVVYPLLAPAIIQLAARMNTHVVRNDRVAECKVVGKDYQQMNPQSMTQSAQMQPQQSQPTQSTVFVKAQKAKRVSDYMSYECLFDSDTWLLDDQKLNTIVASWGVGFKQVTYDPITKKNKSELLCPEDIIINQNISCLEKAPRITVKHYMTKNDIVLQQRQEYFIDFDVNELELHKDDNDLNTPADVDSEEPRPPHVILCQDLYLDLDDDDLEEPYRAYVHEGNKKLLGLVPAFEIESGDVDIDPQSGKIKSILRRLNIVDRHLIDDPEGKYWSLGLNYILLHINKAQTAILRQLIDAGMLSNAAAVSGFITKAFKTREKDIRIKMGSFPVLDCNPNVNPQQQIIQMPFREPSQVLLGLLQLLIQSGKEMGFITDVLTGDTEMQNVPATTMMAMVEQGTRAFKPIIQKLYISLRKEFKIRFHLNRKYLDDQTYANVIDEPEAISKQDFDEASIDIIPVADPTQSSEAHRYAQLRAIIEALQTPMAQRLNLELITKDFLSGIGISNAETYIVPPPPPPQDPKMLQVQLQAQLAPMELQIKQLEAQVKQYEAETEKMKVLMKMEEVKIKAGESQEKQMKMRADAMKDQATASIAHKQAQTQAESVQVEREKVEVMKLQAKNKSKPKE